MANCAPIMDWMAKQACSTTIADWVLFEFHNTDQQKPQDDRETGWKDQPSFGSNNIMIRLLLTTTPVKKVNNRRSGSGNSTASGRGSVSGGTPHDSSVDGSVTNSPAPGASRIDGSSLLPTDELHLAGASEGSMGRTPTVVRVSQSCLDHLSGRESSRSASTFVVAADGTTSPYFPPGSSGGVSSSSSAHPAPAIAGPSSSSSSSAPPLSAGSFGMNLGGAQFGGSNNTIGSPNVHDAYKNNAGSAGSNSTQLGAHSQAGDINNVGAGAVSAARGATIIDTSFSSSTPPLFLEYRHDSGHLQLVDADGPAGLVAAPTLLPGRERELRDEREHRLEQRPSEYLQAILAMEDSKIPMSFATVAEVIRLAKSVVHVKVPYYDKQKKRLMQTSGTGSIVAKVGEQMLMMTNHHVLQSAATSKGSVVSFHYDTEADMSSS